MPSYVQLLILDRYLGPLSEFLVMLNCIPLFLLEFTVIFHITSVIFFHIFLNFFYYFYEFYVQNFFQNILQRLCYVYGNIIVPLHLNGRSYYCITEALSLLGNLYKRIIRLKVALMSKKISGHANLFNVSSGFKGY